MIEIYGLKNCDTCRKARKWLEAEGLDHRFHDVRADGLDAATLQGWIAATGWETLLNRRGTTWRQLPDDRKANVDEAAAVALMLEFPALIKRPVFQSGGTVIVGFGQAEQSALASL
jgi:Spx/MgsR family transcriptional regulator